MNTPRHALIDADDLDYPISGNVPVIVTRDFPFDGHVEVSQVIDPKGERHNVPTGLLIEVSR